MLSHREQNSQNEHSKIQIFQNLKKILKNFKIPFPFVPEGNRPHHFHLAIPAQPDD